MEAARSACWRWHHGHCVFFLNYFFIAAAQTLPLASLGLILNIDLDGRAHPEQVNNFYANALLMPAFAKPFLGGFSDWLQRRQYGRKCVLVLALITWCVSLLQASCARTRDSYFVWYTALGLSSSAAEAVLDGVAVELMRSLRLSGSEVQSSAFASRMAGSLIASLFSPLVLHLTGSHYVAVRVCVSMPLVALIVVLLTTYPSASANDPRTIWCNVSRPGPWCLHWWASSSGVHAAALFLFLRSVVPTEDDTFSGFVSTKVDGVWVAICSACSNLGGIAGLLAFQALPDRFTKRLQPAVVLTTLLTVAVGGSVQFFLARCGSSAPWVYATAAFASGAMDTTSFLPMLALCAQCAPKDFEAAGFAMMSLLLDLADQVSARASGLLTQEWLIGSGEGRSWDHLGDLVLACRLGMLLTLPFCVLLRGLDEKSPTLDAQPTDVSLQTPALEEGNRDVLVTADRTPSSS